MKWVWFLCIFIVIVHERGECVFLYLLGCYFNSSFTIYFDLSKKGKKKELFWRAVLVWKALMTNLGRFYMDLT